MLPADAPAIGGVCNRGSCWCLLQEAYAACKHRRPPPLQELLAAVGRQMLQGLLLVPATGSVPL